MSFPVYADQATGSLAVWSDDPFAIKSMFPRHSRVISHVNYNVALKWCPETIRVLRNMGYDAPFFPEQWPGLYKPMPHQLEMIDFQLTHTRCFNLSEQGTMKTASALWAADKLMNEGKIKKCLIITPLSTVERVWQQDIFDVLMHRVCATVHGSQETRNKALKANADFYIMNHDGTRLRWLRELLRTRKDINLIIVDEGGMFRNATKEKFKGLQKLIRPEHRVWWLTGTPCPNGPTDAWSQCLIINPTAVPAHFGTWQRMTMFKESAFKWKPRVGSRDLVFKVMQPAIRFLKKDVLTLPAVTTINLQANLTKEQKSAFEAMRKTMVTELDNGEQITAVNAADKIGKLRQICCGVIKNTETGVYESLGFSPRLRVLIEAIEAAPSKVIVIVPFKGITNELEIALKHGFTVGVLNGDVSPAKRNTIIRDFKETPNPHILLCHPKVMSHGLNLTEAATTIFWAPIYSNDEFEQVIERMNRAGQSHKMTLIKIGAHPLEWSIYKMVDQRSVSQKSILDLYRQTVGLT